MVDSDTPIGDTHADETIVPTLTANELVSLPEPGYQLGELIGHGGMGEVIVAQDQRIGREVAVKRIRAHAPSHDAITRFLREARIQARLDHPAIVPVYELGTDADGRPYFTMKRLTGVTLAKRLDDRRAIPSDERHRREGQPMLRAFVDVCLAIQLAHSRGVVHRDLKPANIMLGDYGEVYVIDWGVARVLDRSDGRAPSRPGVHADVDEVDDATTAGAILGTPGYMAPEQVQGSEVGPPADVYALGAILFEILAGESLHPRGELAIASTLSKPQVAPAARAASRAIPPELDGVCFDALALDPAARPTARQLAERVQAYLDGDRDHERRRALAAEHLAKARAALDSNADDARATAVHHAGRALALEPDSADAAALVTALMLEPPEKLPPDLVRSLAQEEARFESARSKQGAMSYLLLFAYWAFIPFMKVKSWTALAAFFGLILLGAMIAFHGSRRPSGRTSMPVTWVLTSMVLLAFTRIAGPFVLTPVVACAIIMSISSAPPFQSWRLVAWAVFATMLPFALEWTGVIPRSYFVDHGALVSVSGIFEMRQGFDEGVLVVANLVFTVSASIVAIMLSRRRVEMQRELLIRSWHLRQLLPRNWASRRTIGE